MHLDLGQELFFDFSLNSSEHEWSQNFVELSDHFSVFILNLFLGQFCILSQIEPLIEVR